MQLSEHFTDKEFGVVGVAQQIICNAQFICNKFLEPIRYHFNQPLRIHDGYRDAAHNIRVGGKPNSWHLYEGWNAAVDFDVLNVGIREAFDWIRLSSALPFDKVILETSCGLPRCIHLQVSSLQQPRRLAYIGGTGNSTNYNPVEVA